MTDKRIFFEKEMICPLCKIASTQKFPNPKMYAAAARENDGRISSYNWAGGIKTDILPHHYVVLQCPNCLYTDFRTQFENPTHTVKEASVYTALQNAPFDRRIVLRKLRRLVQKDKLNVEGAIALHLCAIFVATMPDTEEYINHMKLGRLTLRLSWLYREHYGSQIPSPQEAETIPETVSVSLTNLSDLLQELKGSSDSLSQLIAKLGTLIEERSRELNFPAGRSPYTPGLSSVGKGFGGLSKALVLLQQTLERDKAGNIKPTDEAKPQDTGSGEERASLEAFIPTLVPQWPTLPQTEISAIKMAIKAFDYSYKKEDSAQNIQQAMAVLNTIIKLLVKIGELEQAMDYIQQIYKTGYRDKQDLQLRLNHGKRDKSISDAEARSLTRQIGIVGNTMSSAAETRRKIVSMLFERDKEKIYGLLKQNAHASPEAQVQAMVSAGFNPELIPFLKEHHLIKEEAKKKKWFGH